MSNSFTKLQEFEIQQRMQKMSDWIVVDNELERECILPSFASSIFFVNAIAQLAELAAHHPDLFISYNRVRVRISTHSQGGITDKDFSLASNIDELWRI